MIKIPNSEAVSLWNDFNRDFVRLVPYSFNPSLFQFYTQHFNWSPYYILIFENDDLNAILPLVNTRKAFVSLPHFSYGGYLVSTAREKQVSSQLIDLFIQEINSDQLPLGYYRFDIEDIPVSMVEHKSKVFIRALDNLDDDSFVKSEKLTSLMELPKSEDNLQKSISPNLKRKIRKAIQSGVTVQSGKMELLDDFHKVYSHNMYQLQSMSYSKSFFRDLFATYKYGELALFVAYLNNKPVGGGLLASYQGFYENLFFASSKAFRKNYVSDLLHAEMINFSIQNMLLEKSKSSNVNKSLQPVYSFGRSTRSSGVHTYKSHWPVTDYPIYHYSNMVDIRKHTWLQKLWGQLPYSISQPLGRKLIKHIY